MKFKNKYRIENNTAIIEYNNRKGEYFEILLDVEDLEKVIEEFSSICVVTTNNKKYASGYCRKQNKDKQTSIHRFIMNDPKGQIVDHVNPANTLDNRKSNLRICTRAQNNQNISIIGRNPKNGVRNVRWDNRTKKWVVRFKKNGKDLYFGSYTNFDEALAISVEKRKLLFPFSTY